MDRLRNVLKSRRIIPIALALLLVLVGTFYAVRVEIGGSPFSPGYLSLEVNKAEAAISVTALGANGIHDHDAGTNPPWAGLTGLSLTADDHVIACVSADAGSSTVYAHIGTPVEEESSFGAPATAISIAGSNLRGQTFTTTSAYSITGVMMQLRRYGSVVDNLDIGIYEVDVDHYPTGDAVTSGSVSPAFIEVGVYKHYILSVSAYALSDATEYAIVLSYPNGDGTDYISSQVDNDNPYAGGTYIVSTDGGSVWGTSGGARDCDFATYSGTFEVFYLIVDVIATNAGNVVSEIWSAKVGITTDNYSISIVNISVSKAVAAYKASGLADDPFDVGSSGTGSGDAPSSGSCGQLAQADELIIGAIGMEEEDDEAGDWTTGAGYVSGNAQIAMADGGGAASSTIMSAAEIVAVDTAQTAAQTNTGGNDWGACVATYKMGAATPAIEVSPASRAFGVLYSSQTYWSDNLTLGYSPSWPLDAGNCYAYLTNAGSVTGVVTAKATDFTGGATLTLSDAAPGSTNLRMSLFKAGDGSTDNVTLINTDRTFIASMPSANVTYWETKLEWITSYEIDANQKTSVITFTISAS